MTELDLVCPLCWGSLSSSAQGYHCAPCQRVYPRLHGIPDFRLESDRYLTLEQERSKASRLAAKAVGCSFDELLAYYYEITDDVAPNLALRYQLSVHASPEVNQPFADDLAQDSPDSRLLDVGCGAGGMLIAAHRAGLAPVGMDIALRWLVVCRRRLDELGMDIPLICADIERPPFQPQAFHRITALDLVEHTRNERSTDENLARLLAPRGYLWVTASNRYSLAPHATTRLWGITWLPQPMRRWVLKLTRGVDSLRFVRLISARHVVKRMASVGLKVNVIRPRNLEHLNLDGYPVSDRLMIHAYRRFTRLTTLRHLLVWFGPSFELKFQSVSDLEV